MERNFHLTADQNYAIRSLVSSVFQENDTRISQIRAVGYESVKDYIISELTQALWDSVEVNPDRNNSGIIFLLPSSKSEINSLDVVSIFDVMRLRLEEMTEPEKARLNHWVRSDEELLNWPTDIARFKEGYQTLKDQILSNMPRELFSPDPTIRETQYCKFMNKFHQALVVLSQNNEDYDFYDNGIPYLLNHCMTAWEGLADQMTLRANPQMKGDIFSKAQQMARGIREDILINRILPIAVMNFDPSIKKEDIDNVHYKKAAKQIENYRLRLGFSKKDLGEREIVIDVLAPYIDFHIRKIMEKEYTTSVLLQNLKKLYNEELSEADKNLVWDLILDEYKTELEKEGVLFIDSMEYLSGLYQLLENTQDIDSFEEYSKALKDIREKFVERGLNPSFKIKTPYEFAYENLRVTELQQALFKKRNLRTELERLLEINVITPPRKLQLESLIEAFENLENEDWKAIYLIEQKKRVAEFIKHLGSEIISKNADLLRKLAETPSGKLTPFGVAFIGAFTKIVGPKSNTENDLPNRILNWGFNLPFSDGLIEDLPDRLIEEPELYPILPNKLKNLSEVTVLVEAIPSIKYGMTQARYDYCMQNPLEAFINGELTEVIQNDLVIVRQAISSSPYSLRFVTDRNIVLQLLSENCLFFPFVNEIFREDLSVVRIAIAKDQRFMQFISDKAVVLQLIEENAGLFTNVQEFLKNDIDIVLAAVKKNPNLLRKINNKQVILELFEKGEYDLFVFLNEAMKNDLDIVGAMVKKNPILLRIITKKEIVFSLIKENYQLFPFMNESFFSDYDFINRLVKLDLNCLSYINDKDVLIYVLRENGHLLPFINSNFMKDLDVVLAAVTGHPPSIQYVTNEDLLYKIVTDNGFYFRFISDRSMVLKLVKKTGSLLFFAAKKFKNDDDVVWEATRSCPEAFRCVSEWRTLIKIIDKDPNLFEFSVDYFKNDVDIVWGLVNMHPEILKFVTNRAIILDIVARKGKLLEHVQEDLKDDKDVVLVAISQNKKALQFASSRMQQDPDIIKIVQNS
ncbi:MAG: DUF4116 domain-containing protein [Verrucomicrobia bacterium]|nr:DUF4116 domain-containing protein [Verrucomicrobiota bacterium]